MPWIRALGILEKKKNQNDSDIRKDKNDKKISNNNIDTTSKDNIITKNDNDKD